MLHLTLYPLRQMADFPKSANKDTLPVYNIPFESHWSAHLRTDISSYEGGRHFERNCFKMQKWMTLKMYQNSTIVGIPLNYSLFSSSQCIASCETSLAFHLHPTKETKNLTGWSTKSFIGGGHNFMTAMRRSSQGNFRGKNSYKSVKYSQSYDFVCQMALLGGKGLNN